MNSTEGLLVGSSIIQQQKRKWLEQVPNPRLLFLSHLGL